MLVGNLGRRMVEMSDRRLDERHWLDQVKEKL